MGGDAFVDIADTRWAGAAELTDARTTCYLPHTLLYLTAFCARAIARYAWPSLARSIDALAAFLLRARLYAALPPAAWPKPRHATTTKGGDVATSKRRGRKGGTRAKQTAPANMR